MLAISAQQPWGFAILHGKDIENRTWRHPFRGRVLLHVGKKIDRDGAETARLILAERHGVELPPLTSLPTGGIVGAVTIVDCVERSDSPWFVGRYGFVLRDAAPLPGGAFVPCRGALGFFRVPRRRGGAGAGARRGRKAGVVTASAFTIGSLFAGIGGLELGLEWAGLGPVLWQVEQSEFCRGVLARHWPEAERFDDVRTVGATNLRPVAVLCGGFPCQDISTAGKGAGLAGERSGLWFEFARVAQELRPLVVVADNVPALRTRGLCRVVGDLAALGYVVEWGAVRASDVGAPHRRERLFVVAHADGAELRQQPGGGVRTDGPGEAVARDDGETRPAVAHAPGGARCAQPTAVLLRGEPPAAEPRDGHVARDAGVARAQHQPGLDRGAHGLPERLDRWPAGRGGAQGAWEPPRASEKRANHMKRLKALGNAVVPQVAEVVGRRVVEILRGAA